MPIWLFVIIVFWGAFWGAFLASALFLAKREDENPNAWSTQLKSVEAAASNYAKNRTLEDADALYKAIYGASARKEESSYELSEAVR